LKGARPEQLVVVVGTGTDVGKTWVSAALLSCAAHSGVTVAARKPAQSFEPGTGPTDADVLSSATGEVPETICRPHRWYEVPFAPPMAADSLGRPTIRQQELLEEIEWPDPSVNLGLVEMAGGVASPIADDGDPVEFVRDLNPDRFILVADAGLGTIHAVRASLALLENRFGARDEPMNHDWVLVVLNRFDDGNELHRRNADWLQSKDSIDVVLSPREDPQACGLRLVGRIEKFLH
jgi:dethiobiotin synthetase